MNLLADESVDKATGVRHSHCRQHSGDVQGRITRPGVVLHMGLDLRAAEG